MDLIIENLSKSYKDKKVVENISLILKPGVYGLLGANGAGKTTLMRMLCGILKADTGSVTFDGIAASSEEYRDVLGYLPQDFGYYPEFTGMEFLMYMASLKGLNKTSAKKKATELQIELPEVAFEPGRSIVADAGLTLYTVGTVKRIPGYKSYVSVDGGMTDNPRFALYGSPYTIVPVKETVPEDAENVSVVGRCCESGDILQENVPMIKDIGRGDILACLTTGAYHYSMASNYNRIPRPAVVMLAGGEDRLAIRRERPEDLVALEV